MNVHHSCALYTVLFYHFKLKITCLERAMEWIQISDESESQFHIHNLPYLYLLFQIMAAIKVFLKTNKFSFWSCFVDYYILAGFITFDCFITTLFHIVKNNYERINQTINEIINKQ